MLSLAVAMGIGRFAFTPVLPMMQKEFGVSLSQAGWLAAANYLGYLLGALSAVWIRFPEAATIRGALAATAIVTVGMGLTSDPLAWLVLRGIAGLVSAWTLIFASAWSLRQLSATAQTGLGGVLYGGVGLGTLGAGIVCLMMLERGATSSETWLVLGTAAAVVAAVVWPVYRATPAPMPNGRPRPSAFALIASRSARNGGLIACYGMFGFGYIIPATFLPMMGRQILPDSALFAWVWPIFGLAALLSTLVIGKLSARLGNRPVWIVAQLVMAAGLLAPVLTPGVAGIVIAAASVGGTFMVITMTGMQEARRLAGEDPAPLIAAMTAAFAAGQVTGPALVSLIAGQPHALALSLVVAACLLVLGAILLWMEK